MSPQSVGGHVLPISPTLRGLEKNLGASKFFLTFDSCFECLAKMDRCLRITPKMGTDGQFRYMWDGPVERGPRVAVSAFMPTNFTTGSSRAPLGRREAPFVHKQTDDAVVKRQEREIAPDALLVVRSQLILARRRAAKKVINPAREAVLALRDSATLGLVEPYTAVCFVQPGPRSNGFPGRGELLCFPDKKKLFCAIDKSAAHRKSRRLDLIEVVPRADVWSA
jgi:hypothetical protein